MFLLSFYLLSSLCPGECICSCTDNLSLPAKSTKLRVEVEVRCISYLLINTLKMTCDLELFLFILVWA